MTIPRSVTRMFGREFRVRDGLDNSGAKLAQILAHGSDVDIDHALDLIMIDFGRRLKVHQLHHGVERGGKFQIRRAQRDLLQIDQVVNGRIAVLVVLHAQEIVVAGLIVHPVIRRDHDVGIQRRDHVVDHVFLRKPQFAGVHAIDIHADGRVVHVLRNVDLAHAGKFANAVRQIQRRIVSQSEIARVDLNVDGRRLPLIEDGVLQRSALEEGAHIRESGWRSELSRDPCIRSCRPRDRHSKPPG